MKLFHALFAMLLFVVLLSTQAFAQDPDYECPAEYPNYGGRFKIDIFESECYDLYITFCWRVSPVDGILEFIASHTDFVPKSVECAESEEQLFLATEAFNRYYRRLYDHASYLFLSNLPPDALRLFPPKFCEYEFEMVARLQAASCSTDPVITDIVVFRDELKIGFVYRSVPCNNYDGICTTTYKYCWNTVNGLELRILSKRTVMTLFGPDCPDTIEVLPPNYVPGEPKITVPCRLRCEAE